MSLSRFVLRVLVRKALTTGRTLAGPRVGDTDITDLDSLIRDNPQPVVIVFTDDQIRQIEGTELYSGDGHILLVLQLSIAGSTLATVDGPASVSFQFQSSSAGLEMQIDFLERQIIVALTDPDNPWAQLFLRFVGKFGKCQSLRGALENGTRAAFRQISIETMTLDDPTPGQAMNGFYTDLVAAIAADPDPDFAGIAPVLQAMAEGTPLPAYKIAQRDLGVSVETVAAIGLEQAYDPATGNVDLVPVAEITIEGNGQVSTVGGEAP